MKIISNHDVERSIRAWADITMLSLELKRAMLKKRYPQLNEDEIRDLIRKESSMFKVKQDE
ncbi:MAG TPA: hypothetical protein VI584_06460 [Nitrospiria bacterium]|nr:hypothetical protein [Nitrospiria bacterium]